MRTFADCMRALHENNKLPATILDEPALRLAVVQGGKKAPGPRRRRRRPPRAAKG